MKLKKEVKFNLIYLNEIDLTIYSDSLHVIHVHRKNLIVKLVEFNLNV